MTSAYVGALDQGTTSTRFAVFDESARLVAIAQREHHQVYPRPGWVEHDPNEIWARCVEVINEALTNAKLDPGALAAVGITNQRETTVVWNRHTGEVVANAIVWQDTRTDALVGELRRDGGIDRLRSLTGLPLATYFSGPKLRWILDNVAGAREQAERGDLMFGTVDTWCLWHLTGGVRGGLHITDVTNASRTQLMNISTLEWAEDVLELLRIPRNMLPEIRASSERYGSGSGPLSGVAIAADLGDQHAALFGQACFTPGDAKNTYGTGCFLLLNTGGERVESSAGLITSVAYQLAGEPAVYMLEGSIAVTGALVQWMRDNLDMISTAAEIETLAAAVADNGGVYIVPAFSGLFAPYWRSDARGVIVGLTRFADKRHLARAALEATAWQTREVVDAMQTDTGLRLPSLKVDGGMVGNELLMQIQADTLGIPVVRPRQTETTALGAAYAAGLAVGVWPSLPAVAATWEAAREWQPLLDAGSREQRYAQWRKAVARTFDWAD